MVLLKGTPAVEVKSQ